MKMSQKEWTWLEYEEMGKEYCKKHGLNEEQTGHYLKAALLRFNELWAYWSEANKGEEK